MSQGLVDMASLKHLLLLRLNSAISLYPIESRVMGLARTIISSAQLLFLLLTPSTTFLVPVGDNPAMAKCERPFGSLSVICHTDTEIARCLLLLFLAVVASGLLPRILSWVHFYASLSIALIVDLPEGGDYVAVVVTLWLAIASSADGRLWHWQNLPQHKQQKFLFITIPLAWAAHQMLKLQMAFIYLASGLVKMSVDPWAEGSALYYVMRSEFVGPVGLLGDLMRWATTIPLISAAASWGTIVVEIAIAVLLLLKAKHQQLAMILAVLLHGGIMLSMGLVTISAIMVGAMLAATMPAWERRTRRTRTPDISFSFSDQELNSLLYPKTNAAEITADLPDEKQHATLRATSPDSEILSLLSAVNDSYSENIVSAGPKLLEKEPDLFLTTAEIIDNEKTAYTSALFTGKSSSATGTKPGTDAAAISQYRINNRFYAMALKFAPLVLLLAETVTIFHIMVSHGITPENFVSLLMWLTGLSISFTLLLLFPACRPYKRSGVLFLSIGLLGVIVQGGWSVAFPASIASWLWVILAFSFALVGLFLNALERQEKADGPSS